MGFDRRWGKFAYWKILCPVHGSFRGITGNAVATNTNIAAATTGLLTSIGAKMKATFAICFLIVLVLNLVICQDYADYARGAGLAGKKNNRYINFARFISTANTFREL